MTQITKVKRVANNSLQAEIVDEIQLNTNVNVLAILNTGDKRFNLKSTRIAFVKVTVEGLELLGVKATDIEKIEVLEYGEEHEINLFDPILQGEPLRLQLVESIMPTQWEKENKLKAAKKLEITDQVANNNSLPTEVDLKDYVGEFGYFLTEDDYFIFSKMVATVESQVKHKTIPYAKFVPESELEVYTAELADGVKVETKEEVETSGI